MRCRPVEPFNWDVIFTPMPDPSDDAPPHMHARVEISDFVMVRCSAIDGRDLRDLILSARAAGETRLSLMPNKMASLWEMRGPAAGVRPHSTAITAWVMAQEQQ